MNMNMDIYLYLFIRLIIKKDILVNYVYGRKGTERLKLF